MEDIWKQTLAEIQIEVSKPIFLTFFKLCRLIALDNSVAKIDAPTMITAKYIEGRYYSLIKSILDKKTGGNLSVVFGSEGGGKTTVPRGVSGPLFAEEQIRNTMRKARPARIRPDYTFEALAVSGSNQLAYTAASTVAQNPGTRYNPLFLYGSVGVGKTHLMNAIANKALDDNSDLRVIYMTTEEFTNEVVEAIKEKTTASLRKKFRNVDILLLDDIQFLTGKDKVQEELFHTFNSLADRGSQTVFSSDRPPSEIKKLETRLASRFEGGLAVDIAPPDFELRTAILLLKSAKFRLKLSYDVAKLIAENVEDTRALEGFLQKLSSLPDIKDGEITIEQASSFLQKDRRENPFIHPDTIIETVCNVYGIKPTMIRGEKRDAYLVGPRHLCMFILKEETKLTLVEIGHLLGGRDHTTVMHAVEKIELLVANSEKTREEILFIKKKLKESLPQ